MEIQSITLYAWIALYAVVFVSGLIRGLTGYGFALIASPLLSAILLPTVVVPAVVILQLGSGLIGFRRSLENCDRRSTVTLVTAAVVTTPFGVMLLQSLSADIARLMIAALTLTAVIILSSGWKRESNHGLAFTVPFGLAAGVFGGACAIPGPPIIAYFMSVPAEPKAARASMNVIFVVIGMVTLVTGLIGLLVSLQSILIAAATSPAMLAGTVLGGRLFNRVTPAVYKRIGLVALMVSALIAALRSIY